MEFPNSYGIDLWKSHLKFNKIFFAVFDLHWG